MPPYRCAAVLARLPLLCCRAMVLLLLLCTLRASSAITAPNTSLELGTPVCYFGGNAAERGGGVAAKADPEGMGRRFDEGAILRLHERLRDVARRGVAGRGAGPSRG